MSFDEMYDEMLHDEFRSSSSVEQPRRSGLARYRTAALVSAGGLAAATAGAFLGGLGGYFTVSPASGSPLTSSSTQVPLSSAADTAFTALHQAVAAAAKGDTAGSSVSNSTNDAPASAAATFASAAGPLLSGLAPVTGTTVSTSSGTTVAGSNPVTGGSTTGPQSTLGQVQQILTINLNDILNNLTSAIQGVISLPGNPSGAGLSGVVAPLTGVLTDVTGTLTDLSSLMPLPSLPAGLPVVSTLAPSTSAGANTSAGTSTPTTSNKSNPLSSTVAPVLNTVTNAVSDLTGGSLPAIPSLPLPPAKSAPVIPSLPVSTSTPVIPKLPLPTTSPVTLPIPTVTQSGGNTCVAVPTPSLPVNVNTTIKVGPVSIGVKTGGSSTGATVCAP